MSSNARGVSQPLSSTLPPCDVPAHQVWDLRGRDVVCTLKGHKAGVTHVRFSPDGKWVASASSDGQVKVRRVEEGGQCGLREDVCRGQCWRPGTWWS